MESWCDKGDKLFDGEKLNAGLWWWSASVVRPLYFPIPPYTSLYLAYISPASPLWWWSASVVSQRSFNTSP